MGQAQAAAQEVKRYLLFGGDTYYPFGGWEDFFDSYDTIEEARKHARRKPRWDWWHVVDSQTGKIVVS